MAESLNIKPRVFPDGAYYINSKIAKGLLGIKGIDFNNGAKLTNGNTELKSNKLFIFKYIKGTGHYSIMVFHSHKFLGVKKADSGLCFSQIGQYSSDKAYLLEWDINLVGNSFYTLGLVGTDLFIEYDGNTNSVKLNNLSYSDNFLFSISTNKYLENDLYIIESKYKPKQYLSFTRNNTYILATFANTNDKEFYFYIHYDKYDGCYWIINLSTYQCLSSTLNSQKNSLFYQKYIGNYDYQKFIIMPDIQGKGFVIELKSNLLRLGIANYSSTNGIPLLLNNFIPNDIKQIFALYTYDINNKIRRQYDELVSMMTEKTDIFNSKSLEVAIDQIHDYEFCNHYFMECIYIPHKVNAISRNAFKNCQLIELIRCDPEWLTLFPNPLRVKEIYVNEKVTTIGDNEFKNFKNLVVLSLPSSLIHVSPNAFENIRCLQTFIGNLKFINLINLSELTTVEIPSFVECIPEKAFAGCRYLKEVSFDKITKLNAIESKAFENCISLIPEKFQIPSSVTNIAPDAFLGCKKDIISKINSENQKLSMMDNLIIDPYVTIITEHYSSCFNIESLEIPLTVDEIANGVFDNFSRLKYVKCDPKWLKYFPHSKIEIVFIPYNIDKIYHEHFDGLTYLNFVEIPDSVEMIEEDAFSSCNNLTSFKCSTKHIPFLDQHKIKTLILNKEVKEIDQSHFINLINLEKLALPDKIKIEDKTIFQYCKKLIQVNNPKAEEYINNKLFIEEGTTVIAQKDYEDWTNLVQLSIPSSVNEIEPGAFKNCSQISYLSCDPKFFNIFTDNCIVNIKIPDFVTELSKGQFDKFYFLNNLILPDDIKINDPDIFDLCHNLTNIQTSSSIFDSLSETTRKRCMEKVVKKEYVKPILNHNPEEIIYFNDDDNDLMSGASIDFPEYSIDDDFFKKNKLEMMDSQQLFNNPTKRPKETTVDDIVKFDKDNQKYSRYILDIQMNIIQGKTPKTYQPKNTSLEEIAIICGMVCNEIMRYFSITLRPVQILSVLRLADNILNDEQSHGIIGEVKTGEGKSLTITVITIVLVKFKRKVDIISSNLELVKRDQSEQEKYFNHFGIKTGVLYDKYSDYEFFDKAKDVIYSFANEDKQYDAFNMRVLDCPVVYSTHINFEYLYLHSVFNVHPRNREYDVVLVDEVDNMFIDEFSSPLRICHNIDFAFSKDILQIVFYLQSLDTSEIIKILNYYFPKIGIFEVDNIEMLKEAAHKAMEYKNKVDYIIQDQKVIVIDHNTGFKRLKCRYRNFIHEMIEIKENLEIESTSIEECQITQNGYFNLYKKITGLTGTIGGPGDENVLKRGYNVEIFRVPRHFESQQKVFVRKRPKAEKDIYKTVCNEIIEEMNKNRPVLVIWDSVYHAEQFILSYPQLNAQTILGIEPSLDRKSIKEAGKEGIVTIATSAAGRGVDIKLTDKSLEAGGLHVIIPMLLQNQRTLEQAEGRAGRQGQPGSVTYYTSDEDRFLKPPEFKKGDEYLVKIEYMFSNYLRKYFPWMLLAKRKWGFGDIKFPYNATPSIILQILARKIAFVLKGNPFNEINDRVQDMSLEMVRIAWSVFFTGLSESIDNCDDWEVVNDLYEDFIRELSYWFHPDTSTTADKAVWHIRGQLLKEIDWENVIICGIKVTAVGFCIFFPAAAPAIVLVTGVVLSGGQEIYHQLQNGEKINWVQVLIRCGGSIIRNSIILIFGVNNKLVDTVNMLAYYAEKKLYDMAATKTLEMDDSDLYYENDFNSNLELSKNINGASQSTNKWLYRNIRNKKKPKHLIKFKPKIYPAIVNIDFIRMSMKLANDAYDGKFKLGKTIFASEENDFFKPVFYCIEDSDHNLFVVTRGSASKYDWSTDFICYEVNRSINGKIIYFHKGFYEASIYVLSKISGILKKNYKTIYFIGHSYAAAVSSVLTFLTKSDNELANKEIYGIAFAPPPAMSPIPSNISDCIYAFINRNDIVPSFCLANLVNTADKERRATKFIVKKCLNLFNKIKYEWVKFMVCAIEENLDQIIASVNLLNVKKVQGKVYRIGIGKSKRLNDGRIKESELPSHLLIEVTSVTDHLMDEYIKSFRVIEF